MAEQSQSKKKWSHRYFRHFMMSHRAADVLKWTKPYIVILQQRDPNQTGCKRGPASSIDRSHTLLRSSFGGGQQKWRIPRLHQNEAEAGFVSIGLKEDGLWCVVKWARQGLEVMHLMESRLVARAGVQVATGHLRQCPKELPEGGSKSYSVKAELMMFVYNGRREGTLWLARASW
jgi:hypothetical protein